MLPSVRALAALVFVSCTTATPAPSTLELGTAPASEAERGQPPKVAREVPPPEEREERCTDYTASMKRGRELTTTASWDEAIRAFDDAIRARPFDAEARYERGRARYANGHPALDDFRMARALTKDKDLERMALIFIAHVQADTKDPDGARLSLAIGAELGSAQAKTELGTRSTCTATWSSVGVRDARIVTSFTEALSSRALVGCESDAEPANDAEARRELCRTCAGGTFSNDDPCTGPGPWLIPTGYLHCTTFHTLVQPLGARRMYVDPSGGEPLTKHAGGWVTTIGDDGNGFAWATGDFADGDERFFNGVRWANDTTDMREPRCKLDGTADVETRMSSGCQAAPGIQLAMPRHRRYFDKSGKGLLDVWEYAGTVSVTFKGKMATLTGAGCNEKIGL